VLRCLPVWFHLNKLDLNLRIKNKKMDLKIRDMFPWQNLNRELRCFSFSFPVFLIVVPPKWLNNDRHVPNECVWYREEGVGILFRFSYLEFVRPDFRSSNLSPKKNLCRLRSHPLSFCQGIWGGRTVMQPGAGDARPPAPATGPGPYALYHFATSGASVAAATAVTHPLG
jgi:hypothetical protein